MVVGACDVVVSVVLCAVAVTTVVVGVSGGVCFVVDDKVVGA